MYASYPGSTAPAPHGGHGAPGPASADAAPSAAGDDWATGEIRRIDDAAGKITLRHGPIPHLDMPPMTMVFQVRDRALLQGLQPGQTVRFRALHIGGAYIVTDIKAGP
nr:copper-binding protein [Tepidimonas charontis]